MTSICLSLVLSCQPQSRDESRGNVSSSMIASEVPQLTLEQARHLAQLALNCIQVEYPNKLSHIMNHQGEVKSPRELHPSFYGCFDWHSSVHGHWMLVHLLKAFPGMEGERRIREMMDENLSESAILQEVAYLSQPNRKSFERTYGWAWLLKLAQELESWEDPQGQRWARNLRPLTEAVVERYLEFLPRQTYPIRTGLHPNTAFGLSFAWDYAAYMGNEPLQLLISQTAQRYFGSDRGCPGAWEPGGADFLSPCLEEANLMRRILPPDAFARWLKAFLPDLESAQPASLFLPATVADRSDPQIVHLDGLNLSRAWCMLGIASALPDTHEAREALMAAARQHVHATLPYIASGNYEGEHWLASFAVYALSVGEGLF